MQITFLLGMREVSNAFTLFWIILTGILAGVASDPNPSHERIEMIIYGVLIKHETAGLILYETGCHDDMEKFWGPVILRSTGRASYMI
jgi:hypothetical protein